MLGQIVVKSLSGILNVVGWIVLLSATLTGLVTGWSAGGFFMGILGMLLGFAGGFIWVTVVLGLLFLLLQINTNLEQLHQTSRELRDKS